MSGFGLHIPGPWNQTYVIASAPNRNRLSFYAEIQILFGDRAVAKLEYHLYQKMFLLVCLVLNPAGHTPQLSLRKSDPVWRQNKLSPVALPLNFKIWCRNLILTSKWQTFFVFYRVGCCNVKLFSQAHSESKFLPLPLKSCQNVFQGNQSFNFNEGKHEITRAALIFPML